MCAPTALRRWRRLESDAAASVGRGGNASPRRISVFLHSAGEPDSLALQLSSVKASSFKAITGPDARVLILGSLPGAASLAAGQYYAHPRNAFWAIMGELVGAAPTLPYTVRVQRLVERHIALWDVCASAMRVGSLDTAIRSDSVVPNDIAGFLSSHEEVSLVCFNGVKASELFRRLVLPELGPAGSRIRRRTLPSTSPAHAGMSFSKKLDAWREALG